MTLSAATKVTGLNLGDTFTQSVKPDKLHITQEIRRRQRLPSSLVTAATTQRPLRGHRQTCQQSRNEADNDVSNEECFDKQKFGIIADDITQNRARVHMLVPSVSFQTKIQNMLFLLLPNTEIWVPQRLPNRVVIKRFL